ncbi:MAG: hypothetical protein BEN19_00030 [Epulopiscium sp. Nuni2H_MBin003]|nr:MAG: hypothetical protein BEN19_00030 [Epulopiscium sp. Nuni2H_MBin003]
MIKYIKILLALVLCLDCIPVSASSKLPTIQAEAAILMDAKTGTILYEKNAYETYYPASITKLLTAYLAIEHLNPNDIITFSANAVYSIEAGSTHIAMDEGEQLLVDQALHALLLNSANEVANGLAEAVSGTTANFADLMTSKAYEFGATSTNFVNPHGLHNNNHYTTPYDMALITKAIYQTPYLLEIMATPTYQIHSTNQTHETIYLSQNHSLMNPIRDSSRYRKDVILGKTGYTSQAGNTLVTVGKQGEIDLIVVIMKGNINTYYNDTTALLDYGFSSFSSLNLSSPDDVITVAPIYSIKSGQLFEIASCNISTTDTVTAIISAGVYKNDLDIIMSIDDNLTLGSKVGDIVGTISYLYDNKTIASSELAISEINFLSAAKSYDFPNNDKVFPMLQFNTPIMVLGCSCIIFLTVIHKKRKRRHIYISRIGSLKRKKY